MAVSSRYDVCSILLSFHRRVNSTKRTLRKLEVHTRTCDLLASYLEGARGMLTFAVARFFGKGCNYRGSEDSQDWEKELCHVNFIFCTSILVRTIFTWIKNHGEVSDAHPGHVKLPHDVLCIFKLWFCPSWLDFLYKASTLWICCFPYYTCILEQHYVILVRLKALHQISKGNYYYY